MRKLKTIEMSRLTVDEFRLAKKLPLIVVLDNVRSLHNVGSVLRTSDAFRLQAVCLCGITACPPHAEIHKTALGAEDSVAWRHFSTTEEAVALLKARGWRVLAVEQAEGSTTLSDLQVDNRGCAIVFGNEVKGVGDGVLALCDGCLEIPQWGTKHSLNVSVAAGIVIWEFARRLADTLAG